MQIWMQEIKTRERYLSFPVILIIHSKDISRICECSRNKSHDFAHSAELNDMNSVKTPYFRYHCNASMLSLRSPYVEWKIRASRMNFCNLTNLPCKSSVYLLQLWLLSSIHSNLSSNSFNLALAKIRLRFSNARSSLFPKVRERNGWKWTSNGNIVIVHIF